MILKINVYSTESFFFGFKSEKKTRIKVRQPLKRVLILLLKTLKRLLKMKDIILNEVNVKKIELISSTILFKEKARLILKFWGQNMKKHKRNSFVVAWSNDDIVDFETNKKKMW